jgi:hypothetical protein
LLVSHRELTGRTGLSDPEPPPDALT